jgi:murein DD-endopeptidase MepM/ murein hydrolase activator NlpD
VIAVAPGAVSSEIDDLPDQTPNDPEPAPSGALGKRVVIRMDDGRLVFYGHLQAGRVRVRRGQRVEFGEQIAEVGNSGDSNVPHLFLDLRSGPGDTRFVFRTFDLVGEIPPLDRSLLDKIDAGDSIAIDHAGERTGPVGELPSSGEVVDFPAGR